MQLRWCEIVAQVFTTPFHLIETKAKDDVGCVLFTSGVAGARNGRAMVAEEYKRGRFSHSLQTAAQLSQHGVAREHQPIVVLYH